MSQISRKIDPMRSNPCEVCICLILALIIQYITGQLEYSELSNIAYVYDTLLKIACLCYVVLNLNHCTNCLKLILILCLPVIARAVHSFDQLLDQQAQ